MILTVTPNPALDMTYLVDRFEQGVSLRVPTALVRAGGKGVNVARVLAQTGHDVVALTTAGGGTGAELEAHLSSSGLGFRLVRVFGATRRSVAIVDTAHDLTSVMNEIGAAVTEQECGELASAAGALIAGVRCVVGSGSLPPGMSSGFYGDLVSRAAAQGIPSIIDATGEALIAAARAGADLVKPNRDELRETLGERDPVRGARALLDLGAKTVLVSLGADGMIAVAADRRDGVFRARFPRVLAGNPTGAGDAAVAAAAACLAMGSADTRALLRRAVGWSAAAVTSPVAGELHDDPAACESEVEVDEDFAEGPGVRFAPASAQDRSAHDQPGAN